MHCPTVRRLAYGLGCLVVLGLTLLLLWPPGAGAQNAFLLFASPAGDGTLCTPEEPCSLATALDKAQDGCALYLAEGVYTGTGEAVITLDTSLTVFGGWDPTNTDTIVRDPEAHPTIIDAEGQRRGIIVGEGITVTLDGIAVQSGAASGNGAGLYALNADLTLQTTHFYSNTIDVMDDEDIPRAYGGGAYVEGGTLSVRDSRFAGNSVWAKEDCFGGGLAISATVAATLEGCAFEDNDAWSGGAVYFLGATGEPAPLTVRQSRFVNSGAGNSAGRAMGGYSAAIEIHGSVATIEDSSVVGSRAANDYGAVGVFGSELEMARSTISGSTSARTSGLFLSSVNPFTLTNSILAGNRSLYDWVASPAVTVRASSGQMIHNTIANNTGTFGLTLDHGSFVALTNTVLVGHTVGITASAGCTATFEATLWGEDAEGTETTGGGAFDLGTINVYGAPGFVAPGVGNYHLTPRSLAVDAGVDAGITDDIDGDERPRAAGYDIGADEGSLLWDLHVPILQSP